MLTLSRGAVAVVQVRQSQQLEREGVTWISHLVTRELGWVFREQPTVDVGIDAHLEVVDGTTSKATGQLLAVQIKAGLSYFASPTEDGWWFVGDTAHIEYWLGHSLPVLVMLYNPETQRVYWQHVSRQTAFSTGKGWKIHVPVTQELSAQSVVEIQPLARPSSELQGLQGLLAWDIEGETTWASWPEKAEFYRHLLSARLHILFSSVVAISEVRHDSMPVDMTVWLTMGRTFDVALIHPSSRLDRLIARGKDALAPIVAVVCGAQNLSECPQLRGLTIDPPLFFAAWSPETGGDEDLRNAVKHAIRWLAGPDEDWC
ncbi:DUF4365 domain-containing protein [Streptomyces luteoverticillatus]|uniref:DUF4365 domain-containing protein n=1 Tax=Streptomyces luteoverticillatus TaxID=66425 RepID=A0A3S9PD37_STRLT|nr:DUF4365 domain-containing protein [Streptomyces luteoverticillatus]AZQ70283.1 DUF4365 domain-containing protein [Streptomyces luteoverticillatus]